jgi:hypothetical protein
MYAYSCGCDYIYKEQDCLAFGPWIDSIYGKCSRENLKMLTGRLYHPKKKLHIELSLMFLKYDFIIPFLSQLLAQSTPDIKLRPETKFMNIKDKNPDLVDYLDFDYGGNRPFNPDDECFFIQKPRWDMNKNCDIPNTYGVPEEELNILREKGLL